jgi:hypothetical protein
MKRLLAHHEFVGIRRRGLAASSSHSEHHPCSCQNPNALPTGVHSAGRLYAPQYHRSQCGYHRRPVRSNPSMPPQSQPVFLRRSWAVIKRPVQALAWIGRSQVGLFHAPPNPAMASAHSSARYSRLPPALRQRCPRPQSARRMKRASGRRGNARRKKRGGSLTPVAPTPRLQVRKQTPSPSSPRLQARHAHERRTVIETLRADRFEN